MKKSLLLLLVLLSVGSQAQNWAPFPLDETSVWRVNSAQMNSGASCLTHWAKTYTLDRDTLIGAVNYKILDCHTFKYSEPTDCNGSETTSSIEGFIRQNESEVFYSVNGNSEVLLFDWSLGVGDTIPEAIYPPDIAGYQVTVESIDSVLIGNQWLKRFHPDIVDGWILEGVGHSGGILEFMGSSLSGSHNLFCYGENGVPVYPTNSDCSFFVGIENEEQKGLTISPNPSTGIFRIETDQRSTYRIHDLFGRNIQVGQTGGKTDIDLSEHPNGIYLITVETENRVSTTKLVKQ